MTAKQDNAPDPERCQEVWQRAKRSYRERFDLRLFPTLDIENTFACWSALPPALQRPGAGPPLRAAFGYEFSNRPDGFPSPARRYDLRCTSALIAMALGLAFRALAEGRLDLIDGHSTNGLIADLHRHRLQVHRGRGPTLAARAQRVEVTAACRIVRMLAKLFSLFSYSWLLWCLCNNEVTCHSLCQ